MAWIIKNDIRKFLMSTCLSSYLIMSLQINTSTEFNKSPGPASHQVRILQGPTEIRTLPVQMSNTLFCTVYLALKEASFLPCQKRVEWAGAIKN